jgi:hypothetical protein
LDAFESNFFIRDDETRRGESEWFFLHFSLCGTFDFGLVVSTCPMQVCLVRMRLRVGVGHGVGSEDGGQG